MRQPRLAIGPSFEVPAVLARIGCDMRIVFEKDAHHPTRFQVTMGVRRLGDSKAMEHHLRLTIEDDAPLTVERLLSRMLTQFAHNNVDVP